MSNLDKSLEELYVQEGVDLPSTEEHGKFDPSMLIPFEAKHWWMEGNVLYAEGNHGIVHNNLPTNIICIGTDAKGLPVFKKVDIT